MATHSFRRVSIFETSSATRGLTGVESAARWLLERWPADAAKPKSYPEALRACLGALNGSSTVENAREALIRAADDAGILDRA